MEHKATGEVLRARKRKNARESLVNIRHRPYVETGVYRDRARHPLTLESGKRHMKLGAEVAAANLCDRLSTPGKS
jgi:hypothetical protein